MVCDGLASVAVHGFDVPGLGSAFPLRSCCGSSADGAAEIADGRPLPPVLARSSFHGRSQYSTAHACKMSCVVIKCVIWCKYVLICELRKGDGIQLASARNRLMKYCWPLPVTFTVRVMRTLPFGWLMVVSFTWNQPRSMLRCVGRL